MVKQSSLPFATNYGRNARIGVLPKRPASRSDQADVRWFELPQPLVVFHVFNAWQEGEVIRLFLCFFDKVGLTLTASPCKPSIRGLGGACANSCISLDHLQVQCALQMAATAGCPMHHD